MKKLLAISGGPDSMLMLEKFKKNNIVVAHVNYHRRDDSDNDESIVRTFCDQHAIPYFVLNVKNQPNGNFQAWARETRYEFFYSIYQKMECQQLLTAHHKDDFLETAMMQMESGRTPRYFGIRKEGEVMGMNVYRPFIDVYWKDKILDLLKRNAIPFARDSTNDEPIYERNRIRIAMTELTPREKQDRFQWFMMCNRILQKKFRRVDRKLALWTKKNYELAFFRKLRRDQKEIIFEFLHREFGDIKISNGKIEGLIQFINGNEGEKNFEIDRINKLRKSKGHIIKLESSD